LFGCELGDGKPAVTSWRTIRTSRIFGVTGGIFSPVSNALSGTICRPELQDDGSEEAVLPKATIPPVNVTFVDAITLAGSDKPEMITA